MTIETVLKDCKVFDKDVGIMFRTYGPCNEDLLTGYGMYFVNDLLNHVIIDDEGAFWKLDTEVLDYEFDASTNEHKYGLLTLWVSSEWIEG